MEIPVTAIVVGVIGIGALIGVFMMMGGDSDTPEDSAPSAQGNSRYQDAERFVHEGLDELPMRDLKAIAKRIGAPCPGNKEDLLLELYDRNKYSIMGAAKDLGILAALEERERAEEDKEAEKEWKEVWRDALKEFLRRKPSSAENAAYMRLFGDRSQEGDYALYIFDEKSAEGKRCVRPTPDSSRRPIYETLAASGVLLYGKDIPLQDRLPMWKMQDLKSLANVLDVPKSPKKDDILLRA